MVDWILSHEESILVFYNKLRHILLERSITFDPLLSLKQGVRNCIALK